MLNRTANPSWRPLWLAAALHTLMLPPLAQAAPPSAVAAQQPTVEPFLLSGLSHDVKPTLAQPGPFTVGVQTVLMPAVDSLNLDGSSTKRQLTLELWYPALAQSGQPAFYQAQTRSGKAFVLSGQARRDASPDASQRYPLVVISHGYTGYRSLMFYLAEHLAAHGYLVAAIDHAGSTNADVDFVKAPLAGFPGTLLWRARDQQAVLAYLKSPQQPLQALADSTKAGLIGYSMGGFGALNTLGGCYQFPDQMLSQLTGQSGEALTPLRDRLQSCRAGQPSVDPAWQAGVLLAPWGGQYQLFSHDSLARIQVPLLFVAGDQDDISGYSGIRWLHQQTTASSRYLLTYQGARHNIAGHPAPAVTRAAETDYGHYAEPSWSTERLNLNNLHFVTAMLNCHLKADQTACAYLTPAARDSASGNGWAGFPPRYNTGMQLEWLQPKN